MVVVLNCLTLLLRPWRVVSEIHPVRPRQVITPTQLSFTFPDLFLPYVNPFVRRLPAAPRLRFPSTVSGPRPITRIVEKPAPLASDFDWDSVAVGRRFSFICPRWLMYVW